jgi:hypothetical protein
VAADGIYPVNPGGNEFVQLAIDGRLIARKHYAWNGANRPAYNDRAFVRPSLVHDAHAQLWQLGVIDDAGRAAELAKTLDGINRERRDVEAGMREQAEMLLENLKIHL